MAKPGESRQEHSKDRGRGMHVVGSAMISTAPQELVQATQ